MSDDNIGYGKPPKSSQFSKGKSGNPKGRPRGSKNFLTEIATALDETVPVNQNGKRSRMTKRAAMAKQIINKAASGDTRAFVVAQQHIRAAEERQENPGAYYFVSEADSGVLETIRHRLNLFQIKDQNDETN